MTTPGLCRAPAAACRTPGPAQGDDAGLGLCAPCEHAAGPTILDLPRRYALLGDALTQPGSSRGAPQFGRAVGFKPRGTPLDAQADDLMGRIVHAATTWEDYILTLDGEPARDRLTGRTVLRMNQTAMFGARITRVVVDQTPAERLTAACRTLAGRLTRLLHAPPIAYTYDPDRRPAVLDGVDAVLLLTRLHYRASMATEHTEHLVLRLPGACQSCSVHALRRADGSPTVTCARCKAEITMDEYEDLVGYWVRAPWAAA